GRVRQAVMSLRRLAVADDDADAVALVDRAKGVFVRALIAHDPRPAPGHLGAGEQSRDCPTLVDRGRLELDHKLALLQDIIRASLLQQPTWVGQSRDCS